MIDDGKSHIFDSRVHRVLHIIKFFGLTISSYHITGHCFFVGSVALLDSEFNWYTPSSFGEICKVDLKLSRDCGAFRVFERWIKCELFC